MSKTKKELPGWVVTEKVWHKVESKAGEEPEYIDLTTGECRKLSSFPSSNDTYRFILIGGPTDPNDPLSKAAERVNGWNSPQSD